MNVGCAECQSVFRVDPAKVPTGGVRARCSVCGGVMLVSPELPFKAAAATAPAQQPASPRAAPPPIAARNAPDAPTSPGCSRRSRRFRRWSHRRAAGSYADPGISSDPALHTAGVCQERAERRVGSSRSSRAHECACTVRRAAFDTRTRTRTRARTRSKRAGCRSAGRAAAAAAASVHYAARQSATIVRTTTPASAKRQGDPAASGASAKWYAQSRPA